MKKCSFCNIIKDFSEFYVKYKRGDNIVYKSRCKECYYSSLTPKQKTNKLLKAKLYYSKNRQRISSLQKLQREDPNSPLNLRKKKGTRNWYNSIFDSLMIKYFDQRNLKSAWIKKLDKLYGTNLMFEEKRISIISNPKSIKFIYNNWKKSYSKRSTWKNRKELDYIFEYCYRRTTRALSNKQINVNQNLWEIRFNSISGFMRLRT